MDDKSNELLRQLVEGQREQTQVLRTNLLQIRFSLRGLLLLMTFVGMALGIGVYLTRPTANPRIQPLAAPSPGAYGPGGMGLGGYGPSGMRDRYEATKEEAKLLSEEEDRYKEKVRKNRDPALLDVVPTPPK